VKSDALSNQLITFTRCLREALPIKYRDVPSAALNQSCAFQLPSSIADGWPLNTQHFGEEICVIGSVSSSHDAEAAEDATGQMNALILFKADMGAFPMSRSSIVPVRGGAREARRPGGGAAMPPAWFSRPSDRPPLR
jgi:hypothetical protein